MPVFTPVKGPLSFAGVADGTALESIDADFALIQGPSAGYIGARGSAGAERLTNLFGSSAARVVYRDGVNTYGARQYVRFTISGIGNVLSYFIGAVLYQSADTGSGADGYAFRVQDNAASGGVQSLSILKVQDGVDSVVDTFALNVANADVVTIANGPDGSGGVNFDVYINSDTTTSHAANDPVGLPVSNPGILSNQNAGNQLGWDDLTLGTWDTGGGDTTPPTITGPTGAPGAASISVNVNEGTTLIGQWTADEPVTVTKSGPDAALVTVTVVNPTTVSVSFNAPPSFSAPGDAGANNVYDFTLSFDDAATPTPNTATQTVAVNVVQVDSTNPSAPGVPAFSAITKTSCTVTATPATDNVGVAGNEYRLDGGSIVDAGNNTITFNLAGQTPGAAVLVELRAYDAAGNRGPWSSSTVTFLIYGLDFDDPALDLEIGNVSGTLVDLGMLAGTNVRVTILDPDTAAKVHEATVASSAAGVLPRVQHAVLDGVAYDVLLTTTEVDPMNRLAGRLIMQATTP